MGRECTLEVEILGIDSEAEYQGRVYDQTVSLRPTTENLSVEYIRVLDSGSPLQVTEDMIGQICNVKLLINPEREISIEQISDPDIMELADPLSKWSYRFMGTVPEFDTDREILQLDIGDGCVIIDLNDSIRELIKGRNGLPNGKFAVSAARTDLIDIEIA
ncbi:hypothetical protein [Halapricum desulfuricans]|uniref:Uncharacterized protein n=1 Tax=Halapricum desulfuricans TaxID=2841257 RepID=A0A897N8P6_9EURY|nr:hypothetical protein [Halapricum desulfuricans]QSG07523.1 hypothetical protein HSR122_0101 [Halapricum desulfuricans]